MADGRLGGCAREQAAMPECGGGAGGGAGRSWACACVFLKLEEKRERKLREGRERTRQVMGAVVLASSPLKSSPLRRLWAEEASNCLVYSRALAKDNWKNAAICEASKSSTGGVRSGNKGSRMEDYNTAMKRMMRNPYEYHHDLGMNYTVISDDLVVGSQPQKPGDIYHLKEEKVAYILCLQQDKDIEYWGIDFASIAKSCNKLGVHHMRRPARDFDPNSLRSQLPKAVSSLEWAISDGKGRVYVHCTAGLGRAPAVAIAYMFWFCDMNLDTAYNKLTSKRPCGPNKTSIRGATYDLAKNDPWKEPFESLPEYAFDDIADWERKLIQDRVRQLRGT